MPARRAQPEPRPVKTVPSPVRFTGRKSDHLRASARSHQPSATSSLRQNCESNGWAPGACESVSACETLSSYSGSFNPIDHMESGVFATSTCRGFLARRSCFVQPDRQWLVGATPKNATHSGHAPPPATAPSGTCAWCAGRFNSRRSSMRTCTNVRLGRGGGGGGGGMYAVERATAAADECWASGARVSGAAAGVASAGLTRCPDCRCCCCCCVTAAAGCADGPPASGEPTAGVLGQCMS